MKLYPVLPLITTFLTMEEVLGSGLRAEVDGRDDPLLLDNDSNLKLHEMSASSTSNGHRRLVQCPNFIKQGIKENNYEGCCDTGPKTVIYDEGSFTRGPYWLGHKQSTVVVGGMCHNGCKRVNAVVTSNNKDKVACGKFNVRYHDAPAAVWVSPNNPRDCRLNIPYCEHFAASSSCTWKINEKCN